jgi:hypothetical protein
MQTKTPATTLHVHPKIRSVLYTMEQGENCARTALYTRVGQKKFHPLGFFLFALIFFAMFENPEKFKIWLS